MQSLDLSGTAVADVEPLEGLTALGLLDLSGIDVADVGPLTGLTALQRLDLWRTEVADVGPLRGLTALQSLDLSLTKVVDVKPLKGLTALELLDLSGTNVTDLGPVYDLPHLRIKTDDSPRYNTFVITEERESFLIEMRCVSELRCNRPYLIGRAIVEASKGRTIFSHSRVRSPRADIGPRK